MIDDVLFQPNKIFNNFARYDKLNQSSGIGLSLEVHSLLSALTSFGHYTLIAYSILSLILQSALLRHLVCVECQF